MAEMCISLTSYWVWKEDGTFLDGWGGQCDSDCTTTANGTTLSHDWAWTGQGDPLSAAACISPWVRLGTTRTITLPYYGEVSCVDAFGLESYRQPFYHPTYERWIVPVDLLAQGVHDLICGGWSLGWTED